MTMESPLGRVQLPQLATAASVQHAVGAARAPTRCFPLGDRPPAPSSASQPPPHPLHTPHLIQAAERIEGDDVILRLDGAPTPQQAAAARAEARAAELNRQLGDRIRSASAWEELRELLRDHGDDLNYVNVALLVARAGELAPGAAPPPRPGRTGLFDPAVGSKNGGSSSNQEDQQIPLAELERIGDLALERASWFQASHFAATAWGLAAAGLTARGFWRGFCTVCERKVPAMTFAQLAMVVCAVAGSE
jgi:hypothetical protein